LKPQQICVPAGIACQQALIVGGTSKAIGQRSKVMRGLAQVGK